MKCFSGWIVLICLCFRVINCIAQMAPSSSQNSSINSGIFNDGLYSDFYSLNSIDTVYLNFSQKDFERTLNDGYYSYELLYAELVYKNVVYDSVGVSYRGKTSYRMNKTQKKSFKISLSSHFKKQNIQGYKTLHLNANLHDPSYMREVVYSLESNRHTLGPRCNFKVLVINGESYGLYTNLQAIDKVLGREISSSKSNWFFRAESKNTAFKSGKSDFGKGKSSLNYLGEDIESYKPFYNLKGKESDVAWQNLLKLARVLNEFSIHNDIEKLSKVLDIDEALWFLAYEIIYQDEDSYVNKGGADYFLMFNEKSGKFVPIEYDGNSCLNPVYQWPPYLNEIDENLPLIHHLLKNNTLRQIFIAHVRTILERSFVSGKLESEIDQLAKQLLPYVQTDPMSIYSTELFQKEISVVKSCVQSRKDFYLRFREFNQKLPQVMKVKAFSKKSNPYVTVNEVPIIEVSIKTNAVDIDRVLLHYRRNKIEDFNRIIMDSIPNGIDSLLNYICELPQLKEVGNIEYFIEVISGLKDSAVVFNPDEGSKHFYQLPIHSISFTGNKGLKINEIMPYNRVWKDENGEFPDWIELYNSGSDTLYLNNHFVSNDTKNPKKWRVPKGTYLAPNSVFLMPLNSIKKKRKKGNSKRLSNKGGHVFLSNKRGIQDEVFYPSKKSNQSYSLRKNGLFNWGEISLGKLNH